MADVLLAYVRDDAAQAEAIAETLDDLGFSIGDAHADDDELRESGARIIVWSVAASQSPSLVAAARRFIAAGETVVVSLIDPCVSNTSGLLVFDLSGWRGDADDLQLDPLLDVIRRMVIVARPAVIEAEAVAAEPPLLAPPQAQPRRVPAPASTVRKRRTTPPVAAPPAHLDSAWVVDVPAAPLRALRTAAREVQAAVKPKRAVWGATALVAFFAGALLMGDVRLEQPRASVSLPQAAAASALVVPESAASPADPIVAAPPPARELEPVSESAYAYASPVRTHASYVPPPIRSWEPNKPYVIAAQAAPQMDTPFALIPIKLLDAPATDAAPPPGDTPTPGGDAIAD